MSNCLCNVGFYGNITTVSDMCSVCAPGTVAGSVGMAVCLACGAGQYSGNSTVVCSACPPGSMTAHAGNMSGNRYAVFAHTGATRCEQCWAGTAINALAPQLDSASSGDRGYADLDSTSSTACQACPTGTYAAADGQIECVDFDECASNPCENGATCVEPTLSGTGVVNLSQTSAADYLCQCSRGFLGELCDRLNECALDPCTLSTLSVAGSAVNSGNRFQCPVSMVCTDPDTSHTDNYQCTCPACTEVALSSSTAAQLTSYFDAHPAFRRFVRVQATEQRLDAVAPGTCRVNGKSGCTDPSAFNYDAAATVSNPGSCVAKVYGCMDQRAINFNPAANTYNASSSNSSELCHGAYCETPAPCISILPNRADLDARCGQATASFASTADVAARVAACEARGTNVESGYPSVCRYRPLSSSLCPHSHTNSSGAVIHGGAMDCSCPTGTNLVALSDGSVNTCSPSTANATQAEVDHCATLSGAGCTGACIARSYSARSDDECAATFYNGTNHTACSSPGHRLCAGDPVTSSGSPGRRCTDFRQAFMCPDHGNVTAMAFNCSEPNVYWRDDYTCSCAYDSGQYSANVAATCGTDVIFTDTTSDPDTAVTNYDLTVLLEASPTTRAHVCHLIGNPSDCTRPTL